MTAARALPASAPAAGQPTTGWRARPWWPWFKRVCTAAFFAAVLLLVVRHARTVDWDEVWLAITATPASVLLLAGVLAACSHAIISSFDLLGRRYTGHGLPAARVVQVNFISYAFNLNMGSLVGGFAMRYRLYSRLGLDYGVITRVISISLLTNWLGYLVVAGALFAALPLPLPEHWKISSDGLRWAGAGLLALAAAYLALCAFSSRRSVSLRGHVVELPPLRMTLVQLALSCSNWLLMGAVVFVLLQGKAPFAVVLGTLLVAAVAGVITHVPAGLGVLEAVFIGLLTPQVPQGQLLAALLTYRALYYILPLVAALLLYALVEARAPRQATA